MVINTRQIEAVARIICRDQGINPDECVFGSGGITFTSGSIEAKTEVRCYRVAWQNYIGTATAALVAADKAAWRPIEEAPKDGTPVLLAVSREGIFTGWWQDGPGFSDGEGPGWVDGCTDAYEDFTVYNPTHFRLLPSGPEAGQ